VPATMELLGERNWWWPGRRPAPRPERPTITHTTAPARHEELEPVR